MSAPSSTIHQDYWDEHKTELSYIVRVRGTKFLWGSSGINHDLHFHRPLILHLRNDLHGESIQVGTQKVSGNQVLLGILGPGECVSIPVQDIRGIFAKCAHESDVLCLIKN